MRVSLETPLKDIISTYEAVISNVSGSNNRDREED